MGETEQLQQFKIFSARACLGLFPDEVDAPAILWGLVLDKAFLLCVAGWRRWGAAKGSAAFAGKSGQMLITTPRIREVDWVPPAPVSLHLHYVTALPPEVSERPLCQCSAASLQ